MTYDEVIAPVLPVIVQIAYAVAVAAVLLLIRHLALRYPSVPARVPLRIGIDGRPSQRSTGKAVLWIAPGILAVVLALLGALLFAAPPSAQQRVPLALVLVVLAEAAWFVAWMLDRQIELARKMTYRIAPARTLRALLPILATIAFTIVLAARS